MADEIVPLEFNSGFMPHPSGFEFLSNPIDVSEFGSATAVCWGIMAGAGDCGRVTMTLQESDDQETWVASIVPRVHLFPNEAFEDVIRLAPERPWLRAIFVIKSPAPGTTVHRPFFHAMIRLEKRAQ